MIFELLTVCWFLEPFAEEIDRYSYEQELMQEEIEDLKEEIRLLKYSKMRDEYCEYD